MTISWVQPKTGLCVMLAEEAIDKYTLNKNNFKPPLSYISDGCDKHWGENKGA